MLAVDDGIKTTPLENGKDAEVDPVATGIDTLKAGLVAFIGPEVIDVAIGVDEEIFEDAVVGEIDRVLFSVSVAVADAVEVEVVVLAGTVTVTLGLSPIGTISYTDMAQGPPQVLLLSPGGNRSVL